MTAGDLLRLFIEGYTAPRHAMRRLLDGGNGIEAALGFLALAFLIEAILAILFGGRGGVSISVYLINIALQLAVFFMLSGLIHGIGRAAGGKGTLGGAQLVVGWHALATSPLTPLTLGFANAFRSQPDGAGDATAPVEIPAGGGFLALIYIVISFWLLANYVAELHRFRNTWGVLGALVGVTFACGIVLISVAGAFGQ